MAYPTLAIIGTAGRRDDKTKLTRFHYDRMLNGSIAFMEHLKMDRTTLKIYSGGAAWADHLAVSLAVLGVILPEQVTLYLPTAITDTGFVGHDDRSIKTAKTCNYYHRLFSDVTGKDSLNEIRYIGTKGAVLDSGDGNFFARNTTVANAVSPDGILLAYTFGSPDYPQLPWTVRGFLGTTSAKEAGLNDGGTADTFSKASCRKWHCRLGQTSSDPEGKHL